MYNITINLNELTNSCFVVMPFNTLFKTEYENILKPAIEELGLACVRGDEIYAEQRIMNDIWNSLRSCRLVVAELTGRNPNVLYEIGLAHALGKPVIIITRNSDDVPFDLKDLRYLFYDVNDPFWGDSLKKGLQNLIQKVIDNPEIGIYLPGISRIKSDDFPVLHKEHKTEVHKKILDISGIWKLNWVTTDTTKYDLILTINQNDNQVTGSGIVTYLSDNVLTVVQETFHGILIDDKMNLTALNYSFIERGSSVDYTLDKFELNKVTRNKMKGVFVDENDNTRYEIEFNRNKP